MPFMTLSRFRVVLVEHGYASTVIEKEIIESAGGEFLDADKLPLEEALQLCESADAIMIRRVEVPAELIARFKRCRMLLRYGVGVDNIDIRAATEAGIIVGHVPSYCLDEVSTHAIALLLACVRRIVSTHEKMRVGGWDVHRNEPIFRMKGKTVGLVGFGNIGKAVARKLANWEVNLLICDPYVDPDGSPSSGRRFVDFDTLCRESDYISLHVPLLPETRYLINRRQLQLMKPGAIIVNTARGPVIEGEALLNALDAGQIAAAALDVFEEEPLPVGSPLRHHPKIVITDHTAWYSEESQQELQRTAAEEVMRVGSGGLPLAVANPEVLQRLNRFTEWSPTSNYLWQKRRMSGMARSTE